MSDRQFQILCLQGFHRRIAFDERPAERFFHIDVTTCLGCSENHVVMLIDPAWAYRNDIKLFLGEHLSIVGIGPLGIAAFSRSFSSPLVFISQGTALYVGKLGESDIDSMSIIPFARRTNDSDANTFILC